MSKTLTKDTRLFAGLLVVIVGVLIALFLVKRSNDNRQRAASSTGTARFLFTLPGGGTTIAPGTSVTMAVQATGTGQSLVDGFQLVANITGSVPTNLTFVPATVNGLTAIIPSADGTRVALSPVTGGQQLTVVYLGANQTAYNANSATVTLGTLTFTAPTSGTMTISINQTTSKILQTSTGVDLLSMQSPLAFTFANLATPTPTAAATPLPTTAATPTPTPRPSPTLTPTPTPIVVTPTPTPFGSGLTVLAKFAGVTSNVGTINVKIADSTGSIGTMPFTYVSNGVYRSIFPLPLRYVNTTTITLSLKPEKHVQQVLRSVAIVNGTIDMTSKPFQPGDLPTQDGVVNSTDINAVIAIIAKTTQTSGDLAIADVNYDGVVNSVDVGLILSTLSTKPDESL